MTSSHTDLSYSLADLGYCAFFLSQLSLEELEQFTPYRVSEIQRSVVVGWGEAGTRPLRTPHKVPTSAFA
ncbi:MAG: hypothetical protein OIF54_03725, partial [Cohaesibacter sp.]|nr:hypothetical protein [Cohaesibacter sp.]